MLNGTSWMITLTRRVDRAMGDWGLTSQMMSVGSIAGFSPDAGFQFR